MMGTGYLYSRSEREKHLTFGVLNLHRCIFSKGGSNEICATNQDETVCTIIDFGGSVFPGTGIRSLAPSYTRVGQSSLRPQHFADSRPRSPNLHRAGRPQHPA